MKRGLLLLFTIWLCHAVTAQQLEFQHYTVEDGLSQNSVLSITQDSRGLMWFGTSFGLNKFDARKFTAYHSEKNKAGLSDDYVTVLYTDRKQTLWVGTQQGLNRYLPEKDLFEPVDVGLKPATDNNFGVYCLYEDNKGTFFAGIGNHLYISEQGKNNSPFLTAAPAKVKCVFRDHTGVLWIGTSKGIYTVTGQYHKLKFEVKNILPAVLNTAIITSIVEDNSGQIWIATSNNGLVCYNGFSKKAIQYTHNDQIANSLVNNNIRQLLVDKSDRLWVGTQEGLCLWDNKKRIFSTFEHDANNKKSISQNSVYSLYEDKAGAIWVGTFFGGVNRYTNYKTPFTVYQSGPKPKHLNNNVISSIIEDKPHGLWIGTEGGGVNYLNLINKTFRYYQHKTGDPSTLSSNLVKVIYKDNDKHIWIGTHGGGLNLYDRQRNNFKKYLYKQNDEVTFSSEITCLTEDSKARFWVGTISGLQVFKRTDTTLIPDKLTSRTLAAVNKLFIHALFEDSDKTFWIGTANGLFTLRNGKIIQLIIADKTNNIPVTAINTVFEDAKTNIWVGSSKSGLFKFNLAGKQLAQYTIRSGLSNNILGILEDEKNNLWISTGNGLIKFDRKTNRFVSYYTSDGIAGNVFNNNSYLKLSTGKLFFGGYNGLSGFWPEQIQENNQVPDVILSSLMLFGAVVPVGGKEGLLVKDISYTRNIVLKHDQNVFTVNYAALNYTEPQKNRYAYKLTNFDKDWNYTDEPYVTYTNLPPGRYALLVKGSNNDGIWSKPVNLGINVLPPFWKTWQAYLFYFIVLSAIVVFLVRYFFLRALIKKNEEIMQFKLNFFTNISHEIKTHLSLIIGPAEKLLIDNADERHDNRQLQVIKSNSESLLQLVNELMDFRRAETGNLKLYISNRDIISFVQEIHSSFHTIAVEKNTVSCFNAPSSGIELWFDKEQMEKVFYNLLSNAYKFTPGYGEVNISIEENTHSVFIKITDNGKGISKENLKKLFDNYFQEEPKGTVNNGYGIGLALAKSIIGMHKGNLAVESEQITADNNSTTFTVELLKGYKHFDDSQIQLNKNINDNTPPEVFNSHASITPTYLDMSSQNLPMLLVVDDNIEIRNLLKSALGEQYNVTEAGDGLTGLEIATANIPDIIISDVMMPQMDGFAFCCAIKTDERTSHIPVVMLTAKTTMPDQISGLKNGADLYIAKPFSIQLLSLQIYNIIVARQRLWDQFKKSLSTVLTGHNILSANTYSHAEEMHPIDAAFIKKIIGIVEEKMSDPSFNIATLSGDAAMSQPVLFKKIKALTGLSTNEFVKSLRLKKAADLLLQKRYTVYEISYMVGYEDSKYFSKEFKKQFGKVPSAFIGKVSV